MPEIGEIRKGRDAGWPNQTGLFIWHACKDCGAERWVAYAKKNEQPRRMRCHSCASKRHIITKEIRAKMSKSHQGNKTRAWKGGHHIKGDGYFETLIPRDDFFYPMADTRGYIYDHRLVVAKALGRCLHSWEIVHHKGVKYPKGSIENKQDNRYPENLQLVTDDKHKQISILENKIARLEQRIDKQDERLTLLEAENIQLRTQLQLIES